MKLKKYLLFICNYFFFGHLLLLSSLFAQVDQQRVAVLMLVNQAGLKAQEIDYLTSVVRQNISDKLGDRYLIMTQENILTLLPPDKKLEDCLQECEVEIGRNLGAALIVTGSVVEFNKSYRLNLKVHETKNAALVASKIAKGNDLGEVEQSVAQIVSELAAAMIIKEKGQSNTNQAVGTLSTQNNQQGTNTSQSSSRSTDINQALNQAQERVNQRKDPSSIIMSSKLSWLMGTGFGTSYSGLGLQAGVQFQGLRLLLGYGILQYNTNTSLPSISLQRSLLSFSAYSQLSIGFNYISYQVPNATPYEITIYGGDLIYSYDIGDMDGFRLLVGASIEKRSSHQKRFDKIAPLYLIGLSYHFGD